MQYTMYLQYYLQYTMYLQYYLQYTMYSTVKTGQTIRSRLLRERMCFRAVGIFAKLIYKTFDICNREFTTL